MKHHCYDDSTGELDLELFEQAMQEYQSIRIKRSAEILNFSKKLGGLQASRAGVSTQVEDIEHLLKGEVLMYGTLSVMLPGADHDYKRDIEDAIINNEGTERVSQADALAAFEALFLDEGTDGEKMSKKETKEEKGEKDRRKEDLAAFELLHMGISPTVVA
jgi:hypothetical protein